MDCDLCERPVEPGQPRFGGMGDGGQSGAPIGKDRHYSCHVERYGRQTSTLPREEAPRSPARPRQAVKTPRATKGPLNRSPNAARDWRATGRVVSQMGRRRIEIECPFCLATFWAFVWSLAGGGKKCPTCGALHVSFGSAHPIEGNEAL